MPSITYNASDFSLVSRWSNGSTPSKATKTLTFEISGIPDGATVDSAVFTFTLGSPLTGAAMLTLNGQNGLQTSAVNTKTLTITGNTTWTAAFAFRANGNTASGSHSGTVGVSDISLVVEYTGEAPDDEPVEEPEDVYDYPDSHNICVYSPDDDDFTSNGLGILTPTRCVVTEEAGGQYELELELPVADDAWQQIQTGSVIKAPVPVVTIEGFTMAGAAYWKVKANQSGVKVMSKVPTVTRVASTSGYSSWSATTHYFRGDKVAYNNKVWQYNGVSKINLIPQTGIYTKAPGTVAYWIDVTSYNLKTNSGKVLATLGRNEVFTKVADMNANWIRVKTNGGVTGYVETQYVEYYAALDEAVPGREIRQQCFRVYRIEKDSDTMMVRVSARHLSYDAANIYLGQCEAKGVSASAAISLIQNATLEEDNRHIYTNVDGTCDLDCSWDNTVTALLNPDSGIVAQLQAKLIRDNDDYFILTDEHTDRGFRIEYGNNMKAVNWSIDTSSMVTRVVPHCKDANDVDMMLEEQWVDSGMVNEYPTVFVEPLSVNCKVGQKGTLPDGTEVASLTAEQCFEIMRAEAEKRFTVDHADEPEITVDVDLLMLGSTVEYQHLAPLEVLFMYDTVHIKHPYLNLDIEAYMTGYEFDSILRRYNRITLTNARRRNDTSVSGFDLRDNSIRFEKLSSTAVDRLRA